MRLRYALLALLIFCIEVLIATTHTFRFIRGSLGDVLVVVLIYCTLKTIRDVRSVPLGIGVFVFACGIEALQFVHIVDKLGLRHGSALAIMIGNTFSLGDIAMYAIGCALAVACDVGLRQGQPIKPLPGE